MKSFWQISDGRRFIEKGLEHMYKNIVRVCRDAIERLRST